MVTKKQLAVNLQQETSSLIAAECDHAIMDAKRKGRKGLQESTSWFTLHTEFKSRFNSKPASRGSMSCCLACSN
jgi:hypothetical protein